MQPSRFGPGKVLALYLIIQATLLSTANCRRPDSLVARRSLALQRMDGEPARRKTGEIQPVTSDDEREQLLKAKDVDIVHLSKVKSARGGGAQAVASSPLFRTVKTLLTFALWFALNIYYNIVNKKVLNDLPLPYSVATVQLGVGSAYVLLSWLLGLRTKPIVSGEGLHSLLPIGVFHGAGQLFTVMSLGAAAVSFTHIVKALEPFFSALVAAVVYRQIFKPQVYAALIPVVAGVAIACYSDVSFSWLSFTTAMASNLAFALRSNYSKMAMVTFKKENNKTMTAANVYAVVTLLSFGILVPVAMLFEGNKVLPAWDKAIATIEPKQLSINVFLSGLFHYLNNEVMYLALDQVHPITLAVGNTAKRVFIIVAALIVFRNPISAVGAIGSAVGIGGVFLYSLTKAHYDQLAAKASSSSPASPVSKK